MKWVFVVSDDQEVIESDFDLDFGNANSNVNFHIWQNANLDSNVHMPEFRHIKVVQSDAAIQCCIVYRLVYFLKKEDKNNNVHKSII